MSAQAKKEYFEILFKFAIYSPYSLCPHKVIVTLFQSVMLRAGNYPSLNSSRWKVQDLPVAENHDGG